MPDPVAQRIPIVGVMGSGKEEHRELAEPLGGLLARLGVHLLTGGGGGVMAAVSRAFHEVEGRRGLVIGVLPGLPGDPAPHPPPGYPNPWVELAIATHLPWSGELGTEPLSRNHINVLTSWVVIALPGGPGTRSEVLLAQRYGKPCIAYLGPRGRIEGLSRESLPSAVSLEEVEEFVKDALRAG